MYFLGALHILATSLPHCMQNDWLAHLWLLGVMALITGSAMSVNKMCIFLTIRIMINLKQNPNEPVSGRRIGLHIRLIRKCILCKTDQWHFLVNRHKTRFKNYHWQELPNHVFCRDKIFVMTELSLQQINTCLSRQKFCHDKHIFVVTQPKVIISQ